MQTTIELQSSCHRWKKIEHWMKRKQIRRTSELTTQFLTAPIRQSSNPSHINRRTLDPRDFNAVAGFQRLFTFGRICGPGRSENLDRAFVHRATARRNYGADLSWQRFNA